MLVGKLVELIQTELAGGNLTRDAMKKYHPAIIKERIGIIYDKLVIDVFNSLMLQKKNDQIDKLSKSYNNVPVECENNVYYSRVPQDVDIRNILYTIITPNENKEINFIPVSFREIATYKNTFSGKIATNYVGYYLNDDKYYYYNIPPEINSVHMNIIPSFSAFSFDDDVPMLSYMNVDIFNYTIASIRGQQNVPLDLKNDSKPLNIGYGSIKQ